VIVRILVVWACNDGITFDDGWKVVIAGAVFGLVNFVVKPVVKLLSLPVIILTFGIALFFVDLLMLALTAWLVAGFDIDGFWPAVGGTVIVWLVNVVLHAVFGVGDRRDRRRSRR
jgi:putative membrane protein